MKTKTETEKLLLPCPFCGDDQIRILPQSYGYSVDCLTCGAKKHIITSLELQAVASWNQRPGKLADIHDLQKL
jgi:Lar family restriction alleviation protein